MENKGKPDIIFMIEQNSNFMKLFGKIEINFADFSPISHIFFD